jgi:hypothetical protein
MSEIYDTTKRCEGITAAGNQCRCYADRKMNGVPYCRQHAAKELRALARNDAASTVGPAGSQTQGAPK